MMNLYGLHHVTAVTGHAAANIAFYTPEMAIRGLGPTALTVTRAEPTAHVLTAVLGFREVGAYAAPEDGRPVRVFAVGAGGPGAEVHLTARADAPPGAVGIGGVHHVAF